ncbi:MAG: alpha/beta hydrolase [Armatimonadetes bacterium]|nr:alpha/beta hydrolase [Armatimonadota bacterium]
MITLSHLVASGKLYQMASREADLHKERRPPLSDVPDVEIHRPLLIVPGWTTAPEKFEHLVARLTAAGRNGGRAYFLREGQAYEDKECTRPVAQVPADARVFQLVLRDRRDAPEASGPQVASALEAVALATGTERADALAYSMGGLGTRVYLDGGGARVGRLMLLGTGNQGTRFADLSRRVIERDIGWAMSMAGLKGADLPAMQWLALDSLHLRDLNSRWDQQRAHTEQALVVGSDGYLTPSGGWWPIRGGDGLVAAGNLKVGDNPVEVVHGRGYTVHGNLPNDSEVYRKMVGFFGWTPVPGDPSPLPHRVIVEPPHCPLE